MADGGSYTKAQRVSSPVTAPQKKNPSKFYSHFLFKALIVTIFLVIIPLLPSEAPDFASPRGWELFHLIFVGIAVSYGLFSRRNYGDSEGNNNNNNNSKFDHAQSYMSRLLQVSSVFDDEADCSSGSDDSYDNKVQTWSSQYYRNQPRTVVTKKGSLVDDKPGMGDKPLLLPVRSLKSRLSDGNDVEVVNGEGSGVSRVYTRSNSTPIVKEINEGNSKVSRVYTRSNSSPRTKDVSNGTKRISRNGGMKSHLGVANEFGYVNEDNGVLRSLSRSNSASRGDFSNSRKSSSGNYGDVDDDDVDEQEEKVKVEENVVLSSPIPWRLRFGRIETKGESTDFPSFMLPPSLDETEPTRSFKSRSSQSSRSNSSSSSPTKLPPSPKKPSATPTMSSSESLAKSVEDFGRRKIVYSSHLPPPPPPPPPPPLPPIHRSRVVKSSSGVRNEEISSHLKDFNPSENAGSQAKARNSIDGDSLVGKSVRTIRMREMEEEEINEVNAKTVNPMSKTSFSEFPKETRDFLDHVLVESDDSESDDENYGEERMETKKVEEVPSSSVTDEGPDVDKKADEFIAKFREQIRLQRIESIKRSTGQLKRSSVR